MDIGRALKVIRNHHHMSQMDVAKKILVQPEVVSSFERGARVPNIKYLRSYAGAFNLKVSDVIVFAEIIDGEYEGMSRKLNMMIDLHKSTRMEED